MPASVSLPSGWQVFCGHGLWFLLKADRQTTPYTQVLFKIWCKRNDVTEIFSWKKHFFLFLSHPQHPPPPPPPPTNLPHTLLRSDYLCLPLFINTHRVIINVMNPSRIRFYSNKSVLFVVFAGDCNQHAIRPACWIKTEDHIRMKLEAQSERFRPGNSGVLALVIVARQSEEIQWPP